MSDWTAPGERPSEQPQPRYGELAPDGWTPAAPPPPTWTPPPKPGLIPLRPLTLGDVVAASFQVIRRNPRPTFGFALIVRIAVTAAVGGVVGGLGWSLYGRFLTASDADRETIGAGSILLFVLSGFVAWAVSSALAGIVQGIVSLEVARESVGEKLTLRQLWRAARGRIWVLMWWTLLVSITAAIAVAIVAGVVAAFASLGTIGIVIGILVGLLVGAGMLCLSVWLWVKLMLVPTILVVERRRLGAAMRRSWALTRGRWWRSFGIMLLIYAIVTIASEIISTPITLIGGLIGGVVNPNGTEDVTNAWTIGTIVVSAIVGAVFGAVASVAEAAAPTALYLDARMRQEGLDLELQRYVEETAAGRDVEDPFRVPETPARTAAVPEPPADRPGSGA